MTMILARTVLAVFLVDTFSSLPVSPVPSSYSLACVPHVSPMCPCIRVRMLPTGIHSGWKEGVVTPLLRVQVGGFYVNLVPVWIAWAKYLSFLFYGYNLLLKIEYQGRTIWDCHGTNPPHPEHTRGCTPIPTDALKQALRLQVGGPPPASFAEAYCSRVYSV
jgi:hypothetical protein